MASFELGELLPVPKQREPARLTVSKTSSQRRPGILSGLDSQNVIDVSDDDEIVPSSSICTSRRHATRASIHGRADALYDMEYHPMDEFTRPSQAAKRQRLTDATESSQEEEDSEEYAPSSSGLRPESKPLRHSARTASKPPVNYNARIHPQDNVLAELGVPGFIKHRKLAAPPVRDQVSSHQKKSKSCSLKPTARVSPSSARNTSTMERQSPKRKQAAGGRRLQNSPQAIKRYAEPLSAWTLGPGERFFRHEEESWLQNQSEITLCSGDSEANFTILSMRRVSKNHTAEEELGKDRDEQTHLPSEDDFDVDTTLIDSMADSDEEEPNSTAKAVQIVESPGINHDVDAQSDEDESDYFPEKAVTLPQVIRERTNKANDVRATSDVEQRTCITGDPVEVSSSADELTSGSVSSDESGRESDEDDTTVDSGRVRQKNQIPMDISIPPPPARKRNASRKNPPFDIYVDDDGGGQPSPPSMPEPRATEDFEQENLDIRSGSESSSDSEARPVLLENSEPSRGTEIVSRGRESTRTEHELIREEVQPESRGCTPDGTPPYSTFLDPVISRINQTGDGSAAGRTAQLRATIINEAPSQSQLLPPPPYASTDPLHATPRSPTSTQRNNIDADSASAPANIDHFSQRLLSGVLGATSRSLEQATPNSAAAPDFGPEAVSSSPSPYQSSEFTTNENVAQPRHTSIVGDGSAETEREVEESAAVEDQTFDTSDSLQEA